MPSRAHPEGGILVVGAGAVGLLAAIALARAGHAVTLLGRTPPARPGRTVALLQGSADLLRRLQIWSRIEGEAAPLEAMRIVDATGSLFAPAPTLFRASELGLPAFGYNVDNAVLERALAEAASGLPNLRIVPSPARRYLFAAENVSVETDDAGTLTAALVVAADGRDSLARKAGGIGVRATDHPQHALTALLSHAAPHHGISTEYHTRSGPFTLVPLPGHEGRASSLVWVMSPTEASRRESLAPERFAAEAERLCRRLLGRMVVCGPIGRFPIGTRVAMRLVAPRLVLVGEAAHALPPIGAQGLNLSLRDVATLSTIIVPGRDPGSPSALGTYERARQGDVALRAAGVGLLNGSLLTHGMPVDLARGLGLAALGRIGPLRRFVMKHGLAPDGSHRAPTA